MEYFDMHRTVLAAVCLAVCPTMCGVSVAAESNRTEAKYLRADLPPLLEFLDGTPVKTMEDFQRRKEEIRRLFCEREEFESPSLL